MSGKNVLVVGFAEDRIRTAAAVNLSILLSTADNPVVLTSISSDTLSLDLLLFGDDFERLREYRSRPGLLNLFDEYTAALLGEASADSAGQRTLTYGSLTLTAPTEYLNRIDLDGTPLLTLRGQPRAFSQDHPLTGLEPPLIWADFWRDWAGSAFFQHLLNDLGSAGPVVLIDCGEADLPGAERVSALSDLVVLIVDYNSDGSRGRAYHYARQVRELNADRQVEILTVPAGVHADAHPDLVAALRENFQQNFGEFAPAGFSPYWFANAEIPWVQYYMVNNHPAVLEPIERLHAGTWHAYSNLSDMVKKCLARADSSASGEEDLSAAFLDARERVQWDLFICYSSLDSGPGAALRDYLRDRQLRSFLAAEDMALSVGKDRWRAAIDRVLSRSRMLVVLISQASMRSAEVRYELEQFMKTGRLIVPVLLESSDEAAELLKLYHAIHWDPASQKLSELSDLMPLIYGGMAR